MGVVPLTTGLRYLGAENSVHIDYSQFRTHQDSVGYLVHSFILIGLR